MAGPAQGLGAGSSSPLSVSVTVYGICLPGSRAPAPPARGARCTVARCHHGRTQSTESPPATVRSDTTHQRGAWRLDAGVCSLQSAVLVVSRPGAGRGGRRRTRLAFETPSSEVSGRVWAFQLHAVRLVFRCRLFAFRGLFTPRTARVRVNRESSVIVSEAQPLTLHVTNYKAVDKGPKRKTRNIGLNIY